MKPHNPIRAAALVIVTIIGAFIMLMDWRTSNILSSPFWCSRAIGADKADVNSKVDAAASCVNLLAIQLHGLVTDSHIRVLVEAFVLLVLVVIVIAGGRLSFKGSKEGIEGNISSTDDPTPVTVVNPPSAPVPTTEAPKPPEGSQKAIP